MQEINIIFYIAVLIMSVIVHEVAHGYAAKMLGDNTADYAGRLTLNPLKHLDPVGSILIPLILVISKAGFIFGWAKPVPYNPNNLRNKKWGTVIVASAGIVANLGLAIFFSLLIRLAFVLHFANPAFISISGAVVLINLVLAFFNLVPIPPLDGSKILFSFLPYKYRNIQIFLEQYSFVILALFIIFLWEYLSPIVFYAFKFLTGVYF